MADAQTLTFDGVLQQAIDHSFELKIGRLDVEIGEQRLAEARAMYLPTLSLRLANEYLYDLSKDTTGTISVGDTLISGNESTYQDSLSLAIGYLLYDFGARELKYQNTERDVQVARFEVEQAVADLKDQILTAYGHGLILQKQLAAWTILLEQRNEVYRLTERLQAAGAMGKVELGNAGIAVAEAVQSLASYRLELEGVVQDLAFWAGQQYEASAIEFAELQPAVFADQQADLHNLPEIKAYTVEIEKKKTEYQIARRAWLPTLSLYSTYRMYGNDPSSAIDSLQSMKEKNVSIGMALDVSLFNGFSDRAKAERLQSETRKLEVERDKKIAEKKRVRDTLAEKANIYQQYADDRHSFRETLTEQSVMTERLAGQQIIDRISFLQQQGKQVEKTLDLHLKQMERDINAMQLQQLLAAGASR